MTHLTFRRLLTLPAVAVAALAVLAGSAAAAPLETSTNWAGYAVTGATYKTVSGTWVQPAVTCDVSSSYSAFWVGLGGYSSSAQGLEQVGTDADCSNGTPVYSVWYELVPAASVPVKLKLYAGNTVRASVTVAGSTVTVKLSNLTRKTSFTKKLTMANPEVTSAEWVAEAPSGCSANGRCSVLPLSKFGSVTFTNASATDTGGLAGTIANPAWDATPIQLATMTGGFGRFAAATPGPGAVPGTLSADGSSFTVGWQETVTPVAPPQPIDPVPAAPVS